MATNVVSFIVYVGTYTNKNVSSDGIYTFKIDVNEKNDFVQAIQLESVKVQNPSFLTITNDKKFLLAVSETEQAADAQIHSYTISNNGQLRKVFLCRIPPI